MDFFGALADDDDDDEELALGVLDCEISFYFWNSYCSF